MTAMPTSAIEFHAVFSVRERVCRDPAWSARRDASASSREAEAAGAARAGLRVTPRAVAHPTAQDFDRRVLERRREGHPQLCWIGPGAQPRDQPAERTREQRPPPDKADAERRADEDDRHRPRRRERDDRPSAQKAGMNGEPGSRGPVRLTRCGGCTAIRSC